MRTLVFITSLLMLVPGAISASRAADDTSPTQEAEKQVLQIEYDWAKALVERDVAWFEKMLVDDWVMVLPDGQICDKSKFIEPLRTGTSSIVSFKLSELRVRLYGQTAVAVGRGNLTSKSDGKESSHEELWTDVYVNKDGRWQCVSAQTMVSKNPVPEKQQSSREDFEEYRRLMQGRWFNDDEKLEALWPDFGAKGAKMVSHTEIKSTADGNALGEVWYGGTGMSSGLTVWDPASKQIRDFAAVSDGSFWEGVRSKQGNGWLCVETITRPDGTSVKLTSILTFSADGNTHTYSDPTGTGGPAVYRRVSK